MEWQFIHAIIRTRPGGLASRTTTGISPSEEYLKSRFIDWNGTTTVRLALDQGIALSAQSLAKATYRKMVNVFSFPENEIFGHLQFFDPLTPSEKNALTAKMIRRHFQTGEQLVAQGREE
jgi:hypothetical protein